MKNEIWKDIPGYEGEYQASTMGRIKSLKRIAVSKNWYTGMILSIIVGTYITKILVPMLLYPKLHNIAYV